MRYDLEDRTARFGINVIIFTKKISLNPINTPLVSQLIRSATSIGANYCEANEGESKKDFIHKIKISKKEAHETQHWLRMIAVASPMQKEEAHILWKEAKELTLILSAIVKSSSS